MPAVNYGYAQTESTHSSSTNYLKMDSLNSQSNKSTNIDRQIQRIVTFFMDQLIENARSISFGIRWLCKIVSTKAHKLFPDATQFELDAVIGRVIYAKYVEP